MVKKLLKNRRFYFYIFIIGYFILTTLWQDVNPNIALGLNIGFAGIFLLLTLYRLFNQLRIMAAQWESTDLEVIETPFNDNITEKQVELEALDFTYDTSLGIYHKGKHLNWYIDYCFINDDKTVIGYITPHRTWLQTYHAVRFYSVFQDDFIVRTSYQFGIRAKAPSIDAQIVRHSLSSAYDFHIQKLMDNHEIHGEVKNVDNDVIIKEGVIPLENTSLRRLLIVELNKYGLLLNVALMLFFTSLLVSYIVPYIGVILPSWAVIIPVIGYIVMIATMLYYRYALAADSRKKRAKA